MEILTESTYTIKVPDERYLGYWQGLTVTLPFSDPEEEIVFDVWDQTLCREIVWVNIIGGFGFIEKYEKTLDRNNIV